MGGSGGMNQKSTHLLGEPEPGPILTGRNAAKVISKPLASDNWWVFCCCCCVSVFAFVFCCFVF